jgi:hypothetical protein
MFNIGYKKEALAGLKRAAEDYKEVYDSAINSATQLHSLRLESVEIIKMIENFVNTLANTPKEFQTLISEITINRQHFETEVHNLEIESKNAEKIGGGVAGAGVAAGIGVAALGPAAAMGIATTFGVASTGTAIAALSGAAATNAALAWLGGGALVAGGAGMAGGSAFLALAGPVGWAIGGAGLLTGGIIANKKNKDVAVKAESQTRLTKEEKNKVSQIKIKVDTVHNETLQFNSRITTSHDFFENLGITNYRKYNSDQQMQLKALLNVTHSLSSKINEKVT